MPGEVVGRATYQLESDATGVKKGTAEAEKLIKKSGKAAEDAFAKQAGGGLDKFSAKLKKVSSGGGIGGALLGGVGLGAGLGVFNLVSSGLGMVTDFLGDAGQAASDLAETQSKLGAVFTDSADDIRAWAEDSAESMGLSQQAALEATGTFGNFLIAMGQTEDGAADMSMAMVQLAADLGSFNNEDPTAVLDALRSGLSGETEPLRRFGVDISDAAVSASLLASGLKKVGGQFTQAQKIQGRYSLIMKQTTTAQGDFARTADGTANATKSLNAQMDDTKAKAGALINNVMNAGVALGSQLLGAVNDLAESFGPHNVAVQKATDYINAYGRTAGEAAGKAKELHEAIEVDAVVEYTKAWQDYVDVNSDILRTADPLGRTLELVRGANMRLAYATGLSAAELSVMAAKIALADGTSGDFAAQLQTLASLGVDFGAMARDWAPSIEAVGKAAAVTAQTISEAVGTAGQTVDAFARSWDEFTSVGDPGLKDMVEENLDWMNQHFAELPDDIQHSLRGLPGVIDGAFRYIKRGATDAVRSYDTTLSALAGITKGSLDEARKAAAVGMAEIRWALKHPMQEAKLAQFYRNQIKAGTKAMNKALDEGNGAAYADAVRFVDDMKAKLNELRMERFSVKVMLDFKTKMGGIPGLGSYAEGGHAPAGRVALVGERGPELVRFGAAAHVSSTTETARMLRDASTVNHGPTYNVNINAPTRPMTAPDIGRQLRRVSMLGAFG